MLTERNMMEVVGQWRKYLGTARSTSAFGLESAGVIYGGSEPTKSDKTEEFNNGSFFHGLHLEVLLCSKKFSWNFWY